MPCSTDGTRMQEKNKEPDPSFLKPFCGLLANPKAASQNMSDSLGFLLQFQLCIYFGPIVPAQFEELLLEDPEVEATADPAGLLVDTDLRM